MRYSYLFAILLLLCAVPFNAFSQHKSYFPNRSINASKIDDTENSPEPNTTGTSGTGANIDVVYHRIAWNVNPNVAHTIGGTVTTYFKTIVANVASITLDLNKASYNNASLNIKYHGTNCTFSFPASGSVNIVTITLPAPAPIVASGTLDSLTITYAGTPPGSSGAVFGYQKSSYTDAAATTQNYTESLSESYEDRDWWPCKADMQDKIDSMDIQVTVPWSGVDTFWVATNGILIDSAMSGANRIFKYKTRYPIASYLVSLSVAKFNRTYTTVNINGTNVPVYYYLLGGMAASYYSNAVVAMNKINPVVQTFSNKYGEYPFKLEKHGFYDGLTGAEGMEHQTFSAIATADLTNLATLTHELGHQWFGDNVTFATWNDIWLAEGFARYSESLAAELVPSLGLNPHTMRTGVKSAALANTRSAWITNANSATSTAVWTNLNIGAMYQRGGMVVSMLRALSGDTKFFQALNDYQTMYKGKAVTTDSLKNRFNAVLGKDINEFFRDFVGGSGLGTTAVGGIGNPIDTVQWSTSTNGLLLRQKGQSKSATNNVTYYNGPVVVRATATGKDTTIIYYDWGGGFLSYAGNGIGDSMPNNVLSYRLSFTPTAVIYDDSARTMRQGVIQTSAPLVGYVWSGAADGNWNNAANWSACCGVPPVKGADITIATTGTLPTLPTNISIRHLTINAGKKISIGANTLTVTGTVFGTGVFTGSATSKLVLDGKAGNINFDQTSATTRSLQSFTMNAGSVANIATNLNPGLVQLNPTSTLTVNTGLTVLTN